MTDAKKYPTREQLQNYLEENKPGAGDYHDSETIADVIKTVFVEYGNMSDEVKDVEDLYNPLWESADRVTPIYNSELLEWLKNNYSALEDYQKEMGGVGEIIADSGVPRAIMSAYCFTLEHEAMSAMQAIYEEVLSSINNN